MIKLNSYNKACRFYRPPIPVERYFGEVDVTAPAETQIDQLLWIPAALVSRFLGQFPHLESEGDELFSVGVTKVVEEVDRAEFPGEKIGAVCNVKCRRAMEEYANSLTSIVKVCTTTRYENRKRGKQTPSSQPLVPGGVHNLDDRTELYIRDALDALGFEGMEASDLTRSEKNILMEVLR